MKCDVCSLAWSGKPNKNYRHLVPLPNGEKKGGILVINESVNSCELRDGIKGSQYKNRTILGILESLGVQRSEVTFLNTVACKAIADRSPTKHDQDCCSDYFHSTIAALNPDKILVCGKGSAVALGLSFKVRGQWLQYNGIDAMYTFSEYLVDSPEKPGVHYNLSNELAQFVNGGYGKGLQYPKDMGYDLLTVEDAVELMSREQWMSCDIETSNGLDRHENCVITLGFYNDTFPRPKVMSMEIFHNDKVQTAFANTKNCLGGSNFRLFDKNVLHYVYGFNIANIWDSLELDYTISEESDSRGLEYLASTLLGAHPWKDDMFDKEQRANALAINREQLHSYVAMDAFYSFHVGDKLKTKIEELPQTTNLYFNWIRPAGNYLSDIAFEGVYVDKEYLQDLGDEFRSEAEVLLKHLPCNPNSPKQVANYVYDEMHLLKPISKGGKVSKPTGEEYLSTIKGDPVVDGILDYRKILKLASTYCDGNSKDGGEGGLCSSIVDGRIHTLFTLHVTNTGRLSSLEPNLQNIPTRSARGARIKKAFIAPPGYKMFCADYKQLEARLTAIISGDPLIIDMINSGVDIHRYAASIWFGVPEDQITGEQRDWTKTGVFAVLYGVTREGAGMQLGLTQERGREFVDLLKSKIFPGLGSFIDTTHKFALEHGYVNYRNNRVRHFPVINEKTEKNVLKYSINSAIQGYGSDLNVFAGMAAKDLSYVKDVDWIKPNTVSTVGISTDSRLLVHDSLIGYYKDDDEIEHLIQHMTRRDFAVPLEVDVKVGYNWLDMEKYK